MILNMGWWSFFIYGVGFVVDWVKLNLGIIGMVVGIIVKVVGVIVDDYSDFVVQIFFNFIKVV